MNLRYILSCKPKDRRTLFTIRPDATVRQAIETFCAHGVGALVVTDEDGRLVGIITHRDVLRQIHERPDALGSVKVRDFMTQNPVVADVEDDVHKSLAAMSNRRIRHLPVIEGDRVIGLVTIGDILRELYQQNEIRIRRMSDFMPGTYGLRVY